MQGHTAHVQAVAAAKVGVFLVHVVVMGSMEVLESMEFIDESAEMEGFSH